MMSFGVSSRLAKLLLEREVVDQRTLTRLLTPQAAGA
jgi:hypothetical protein